MTRLMLDGHPGLACTGEHDFLFQFLHEATPGAWRYDLGGLEADRIFRSSGLTFPRGMDGTDALCAMIQQIAEIGKGRPVLVLHAHLEAWSRLLPNAPVIHLVRDARDVARSSIGMGWAGNVYYGATNWLNTERAWLRFPDARRKAAYDMRYEALVAEPEAELAKLCTWLGLDYAPSMLTYDKTSTYSLPDGKLASQWTSRLSNREVGLVEARLGPLLAERGYAPAVPHASPPTAIERAWLFLQNKIAIWRHSIKKYGLGLTLGIRVTRWLGLKNWQQALMRRIDLITERHLK